MNLLSKPYKITLQMLEFYLCQLFTHPVRTKLITNYILAGLAYCILQQLSKYNVFSFNKFLAFANFNFLFGEPVPDYFYKILSNYLIEKSVNPSFQLLLIKRFFFMPVYSFFSMYMLSRFEGVSHENSWSQALHNLPSVVKTNWKYFSLLEYLKFFYIPSVFRSLFSYSIGFMWILYLSTLKHRKLD